MCCVFREPRNYLTFALSLCMNLLIRYFICSESKNVSNMSNYIRLFYLCDFFFFLNDPAPPETSPLPLPDALPISRRPPADSQPARDIFRELIEINTTDSLGNTPRAARAMAQRLLAAGFPAADVRVLLGPDAK